MVSIQEFFDKYNGVGIDYDGFYGNQCMDEFLQYNQDVVNAPRVYGNAKDVWNTYPTAFYDQIPNTPDGVPQCGDVMIWGTGIGPYGHIAIVRDANVNSFTSLDQNWNNVQVCEFIKHNYNAVLGWLRPKIFEPKPAPTPEPSVQPAPQPVVESPVVNTDIPVTTNTDTSTINVPVTTTTDKSTETASNNSSTPIQTTVLNSTPTTETPPIQSKPQEKFNFINWLWNIIASLLHKK